MRDEEKGAQVREYLEVLRRRWGVIVLVVLVTSASALLVSLRTPKVYTADTQVVVQPITNSTSTGNSDLLNLLANPTLVLTTDVALIKGDSVLGPAAKALGLPSSVPLNQALRASLVVNTQIIDIRVSHHVPATARDWANAVANSFVDVQHNLIVQKVATQTQKLLANIADVQGQLVAAQGSKISATVIPALTSQVSALQIQLNALPAAGLLDTGGAAVSTPAITPITPSSPKIKVNVALGAILGLLLAAALALLSESLDDRLRGADDVERRVGAPVLGSIPFARELSGRAATPAAVHDPTPPVAEACRTIRTNLRFLSVERPIRTLLITSSVKAEGKSTTAANLAVAFAMAGIKTILVSADLRRPSVHKFFGLKNSEGLVDAILPGARLEGLLQANALPDFRFLAAGRTPPNPAEILSSSRFADVLGTLQAAADLVIIDSTPMLGVADAGALASKVDGVLVVVNPGQVSRRTLGHATEQLTKAGGHVLGAVLNAVTSGHGYSYEYGYDYYYYADDKQNERSKRRGLRRRRKQDRESDRSGESAGKGETSSGGSGPQGEAARPTMEWGTGLNGTPETLGPATEATSHPGAWPAEYPPIHPNGTADHSLGQGDRRSRYPLPSVLAPPDEATK